MGTRYAEFPEEKIHGNQDQQIAGRRNTSTSLIKRDMPGTRDPGSSNLIKRHFHRHRPWFSEYRRLICQFEWLILQVVGRDGCLTLPERMMVIQGIIPTDRESPEGVGKATEKQESRDQGHRIGMPLD
jgi:hypothetical protein